MSPSRISPGRRCTIQRPGISRLPEPDGDKPGKRKFKPSGGKAATDTYPSDDASRLRQLRSCKVAAHLAARTISQQTRAKAKGCH